jgi:hypothetical protein
VSARSTAEQRREAALALVPVARRQVEQREREAVVVQASADLLRRHGVRKHELDAAEPGIAGRRKAVEERQLRKEEAQIGCEARHGRML